MEETSKKLSVALTDHEIEIVQEEAAMTGINNFSATLRKIIREWARQNIATVPVKVEDPTP